jgi:hypothetical protein
MKRMSKESGKFWLIILASIGLIGWMMPTEAALGQDFEIDIDIQNKATLNKNTGDITLNLDVTCTEDGTVRDVFCSAFQQFGRTQASAFTFIFANVTCEAGEVTTVPLTLTTNFGEFKPGPTPVGCTVFACSQDTVPVHGYYSYY